MCFYAFEGLRALGHLIFCCDCTSSSEVSDEETASVKHPAKYVCPHRIPTTMDESRLVGVNPGETSSLPQVHAPSSDQLDPRKCPLCRADKPRRRSYRWKVIVGLALPDFLASMDTTIVATSLATIASHFHKLESPGWIITAYTLTEMTFIPIFGQFADVFGRHSSIQLAVFFMLLGSVLCATSQAWAMLLLGRAFQGISVAGITDLVNIILSDKVSLQEISINQSIFVMVSGVSYGVGPVIGGYLSQINWRLVFVIPIPLSILTHVIIFFLLRKELVSGEYKFGASDLEESALRNGLARIDIGGSILFICGIGLLILAFDWGGSEYDWDSYEVLLPLVIGSVLFVAFWIYEYLLEPGRRISRAFPRQVPMIPFRLFARIDTLLLVVINIAAGAALYGVIYFIALYWSLVEVYSPSDAGIQLLYYIPGMAVGVFGAMIVCTMIQRQTFPSLLTSSLIETAGIAALTWAVTAHKPATVDGLVAVAGVGAGLRFMSINLHATGIWPSEVAAIMSLLDFAAPFGSTIAIIVMTTVFESKLTDSITTATSSAFTVSLAGIVETLDSLSEISGLPNHAEAFVRDEAAKAIMWSFVSILPIMVFGVVAAAALGNVWLRVKKDEPGRANGAVVYSSYLLCLVRGTLHDKKRSLDVRWPNEEEVGQLAVVPNEVTHIENNINNNAEHESSSGELVLRDEEKNEREQ